MAQCPVDFRQAPPPPLSRHASTFFPKWQARITGRSSPGRVFAFASCKAPKAGDHTDSRYERVRAAAAARAGIAHAPYHFYYSAARRAKQAAGSFGQCCPAANPSRCHRYIECRSGNNASRTCTTLSRSDTCALEMKVWMDIGRPPLRASARSSNNPGRFSTANILRWPFEGYPYSGPALGRKPTQDIYPDHPGPWWQYTRAPA